VAAGHPSAGGVIAMGLPRRDPPIVTAQRLQELLDLLEQTIAQRRRADARDRDPALDPEAGLDRTGVSAGVVKVAQRPAFRKIAPSRA
jgi:hypothetical protein